jgi:hypothetical protein
MIETFRDIRIEHVPRLLADGAVYFFDRIMA